MVEMSDLLQVVATGLFTVRECVISVSVLTIVYYFMFLFYIVG